MTADIWQYTFIEGRGAAVERGVIIADDIALVAEEIVMAYDENGEEWDAEAEKEVLAAAPEAPEEALPWM